MKKSTGDVLTIEELAIYLKIPKSTLYQLAREGKIPSHKIGRRWRFHKRSIARWLGREREANSGAGGSR
jgi:excisionase family DNA binding protein